MEGKKPSQQPEKEMRQSSGERFHAIRSVLDEQVSGAEETGAVGGGAKSAQRGGNPQPLCRERH